MSEPTYAQTVTRLARDYRDKLDNAAARNDMLDQLFAAASIADISVPDAVEDLFNEIWPA